jgi:protein gp37
MPMNEQKAPKGIEWTRIRNPDGTMRKGFTWNPIAGCLHDCEWNIAGQRAECYAKTIAEKFTAAYPDGFAAYYWHPKRLREPLNQTDPAGIFPDSMSDLFGSWVQREHLLQVLDVMRQAHWHVFQALTKNTVGYNSVDNLPLNLWPGISSPPDHMFKKELKDKQKQAYLHRALKTLQKLAQTGYTTWMSFEPLSQDWAEIVAQYPGALKWAVIGAASNGKAYYPPEEQHVQNLLNVLDSEQVPVFYKGNMKSLLFARCHWREEFPLVEVQSIIA